MKTSFKILGLVALTMGLGACSTCVKKADYEKVPYTPDRTAGKGYTVFGSQCETEPTPAVVETPAPAQPAPMAAPVQEKASDTFSTMQSK